MAAAKELAVIAGVDAEEYGLDMLKAGANLSDKTIEQLVNLDSKEFAMNGAKVEIAQVNAVDVNDVLTRRVEIQNEINIIIDKKGLDLFLFVVTDILNNDSVCLAFGKEASLVEKAYNVKLEESTAVLKGVVSRKAQIVPVLTDTFNQR